MTLVTIQCEFVWSCCGAQVDNRLEPGWLKICSHFFGSLYDYLIQFGCLRDREIAQAATRAIEVAGAFGVTDTPHAALPLSLTKYACRQTTHMQHAI